MDNSKDNGVSPVIATVLLLALSVVLIALVAAVVMAEVNSFTPVENKVVGFTVEVNATNNTALITPVAGTDLPFLTSYRVYTNNGHWDSPDAQGIRVPDFNSTVTYVNIVGNFSDRVTALVFSGKVVIEGGVIIVTPVVNPYYGDGSWGNYTNMTQFASVLNDWYHTYYNTTEDALIPGGPSQEFTFINLYPIIASQPIEISQENIASLTTGNIFVGVTSGAGTILRAPGYDGVLLIIGDGNTNKVTINGGVLTIDGDKVNTSARSPAVVVKSTASLEISNAGSLVIQNNNNVNISAPGGGLYNEGSIVVKDMLRIVDNDAYNGGGIYTSGSITKSGVHDHVYVMYNHAINNGGGVYIAGGNCPTSDVTSNTAGGLGPNVYNA